MKIQCKLLQQYLSSSLCVNSVSFQSGQGRIGEVSYCSNAILIKSRIHTFTAIAPSWKRGEGKEGWSPHIHGRRAT